jgi:hypothetical protein
VWRNVYVNVLHGQRRMRIVVVCVMYTLWTDVIRSSQSVILCLVCVIRNWGGETTRHVCIYVTCICMYIYIKDICVSTCKICIHVYRDVCKCAFTYIWMFLHNLCYPGWNEDKQHGHWYVYIMSILTRFIFCSLICVPFYKRFYI